MLAGSRLDYFQLVVPFRNVLILLLLVFLFFLPPTAPLPVG